MTSFEIWKSPDITSEDPVTKNMIDDFLSDKILEEKKSEIEKVLSLG